MPELSTPPVARRVARLIYNPAAGRGRAHGLLPEIRRALQTRLLLSYRTPQVTLECHEATFTQRITRLNIGNGRCSGGGFWLTPQAELDDGLLDVCVIGGLSKPQIMALVPHVMKGTHVSNAPVQMKRARRIVITSSEPLPVHADGEILYTAVRRLEVDVLPGRLTMLA